MDAVLIWPARDVWLPRHQQQRLKHLFTLGCHKLLLTKAVKGTPLPQTMPRTFTPLYPQHCGVSEQLSRLPRICRGEPGCLQSSEIIPNEAAFPPGPAHATTQE